MRIGHRNPWLLASFFFALSVIAIAWTVVSWTDVSPILTRTAFGLGTRFIFEHDDVLALGDSVKHPDDWELLGTINCMYMREYVPSQAGSPWMPWKQYEKSFVSITLKPGATVKESAVTLELQRLIAANPGYLDIKYPQYLGSTSPEFVWWRGLRYNVTLIGRWLGVVLTVLFFLPSCHYFAIIRRERQRLAKERCPQCGYDLRGALDKGCPECGWNRPQHSQ
jgi:hypothetical protein